MIIEVRPGEGGEDAERFADECFDAMLAVARHNQMEPQDVTRTSRIRTLNLASNEVELFSRIAGTHRVQRIPKGSASRHTSTATIVVLEDALAPVG